MLVSIAASARRVLRAVRFSRAARAPARTWMVPVAAARRADSVRRETALRGETAAAIWLDRTCAYPTTAHPTTDAVQHFARNIIRAVMATSTETTSARRSIRATTSAGGLILSHRLHQTLDLLGKRGLRAVTSSSALTSLRRVGKRSHRWAGTSGTRRRKCLHKTGQEDIDPARRVRPYLQRASVERAEPFVTDTMRKNLRFHDLRASSITWMAMCGNPPQIICSVSGTKTETIRCYQREAEVLIDGFGEVFPPLPPSLMLPR